MEHNSIDCNEEESENSSENSFNEVANVALAVGYAMSGLLAPPQLPLVYQPVYLQLDLNGRQWVENVLADASRCFDNFRMQPANFYRLHHMLTTYYGLESSRDIHTKEALGMFLWAVGTTQPMRQMHERFRRGLGTCTQMIANVLNVMVQFADDVLRPRDSTYAEVPDELKEYSPLFDGCIGAIDGTHIEVCVDEAFHDDFTNRHGWRSQNVICVCNFNMMFTYVGVGMEGSANDMRVFKKKALMDGKFPQPPKGLFAKILAGCIMCG